MHAPKYTQSNRAYREILRADTKNMNWTKVNSLLQGIQMKVEIKELSLLHDERGWLTEILASNDDSERIKQVHFAISKPGAVRGNHYHKNRTEWLCVTSGTGRILLEDTATHERKELIVTGDSPVLVKIFPCFVKKSN